MLKVVSWALMQPVLLATAAAAVAADHGHQTEIGTSAADSKEYITIAIKTLDSLEVIKLTRRACNHVKPDSEAHTNNVARTSHFKSI